MAKRKRNLQKNYIANTTYQVLCLLIPLFTIPYLSRVLGAEGIGLYSFNYSIASYFILFAISGTGTYGQREIAYRQGSTLAISRTFWEVEILRIILSSICLVAYIFYIYFFGADKIMLLILLPHLFGVAIDISWFWMGLEKFSSLAVRYIAVKVLYVIYEFTAIRTPDDIYLYVAGEVGFSLASYFVLWPGISKYLVKVRRINPFLHFKQVLYLFIPTLALQMYTVLDKTMLGMFSGGVYAENGYYEQAQGIVKSCLVLVTSLVSVMSPSISYLHKHNQVTEMKDYLYLSYRYVWFISSLIFDIIFIIAPILVPIYLGPGFEKVAVLIRVCSPLFFAIGLSNVTGLQYFVPCDRVRQHTIALLSGALINVFLNTLLIPKYQSVGASAASVAAECVVTVVQFSFVFSIGTLRISSILKSAITYLVAGIVAFVPAYLLLDYLNSSLFSVIIEIVFIVIVYILVLLLLRDKMVYDFLHRMLLKRKGVDNDE